MEMMGCQNLAVPAEVMQHVVNVESSRNPYAIGVVGGKLVRQPQNLPEAVATVRMLEKNGYNYSLGVAQVNRANLGKYGLDTYEKAFEYCPNLSAGSQILAQCYASASKDWGKAFSCYYSGNFTTGYQDGYVQRIYNSMAKSGMIASAPAIPLEATRIPVRVVSVGNGVTGVTTDGPAYRVAMRRVVDAATAAVVGPAVASASGSGMRGATSLPRGEMLAQMENMPVQTLPAGVVPVTNAALTPTPQAPLGAIPTDAATAAALSQVGARLPQVDLNNQPGRIRTDPGTAAVMSQIGVSANARGSAPAEAPQQAGDPNIFVPQVRGPHDVAPTQGSATPAVQPGPRQDPADLRNGGSDGAFVF
jgi:type IV secretion system protein VirB1